MKPKKRQPVAVRPGKAHYFVKWWPDLPNVEWYHSKATAQKRLTKLHKAGITAYLCALSEE